MYAPMNVQNAGIRMLGAENALLPEARQMFGRAMIVGGIKRAQAVITRRSRRLLVLGDVKDRVVNRHHLGVQTVMIEDIRGTMDKADAFDSEFYPLHETSMNRWVGVAGAIIRGEALPPIELIQVGDTYYVSDGHHRVSVARVMGQKAIEAVVIRWKLA